MGGVLCNFLHSTLLTVEDVARLSGFGPKAVRKAIARGELRGRKLCGRWRIREEDYEAWVEAAAFVPSAAAEVKDTPTPPASGSLAALKRIEAEAA